MEPFPADGNKLDNNFALLEIFIVSVSVLSPEAGTESAGDREMFCRGNIADCMYPVDIIPLTIDVLLRLE